MPSSLQQLFADGTLVRPSHDHPNLVHLVRPLTERGLKIEDVVALPPVLPRLKHHALTISPEPVSDTSYNRFTRGGTDGAGHRSAAEAIDRIIAHVNGPHAQTYSYAYLYDV